MSSSPTDDDQLEHDSTIELALAVMKRWGAEVVDPSLVPASTLWAGTSYPYVIVEQVALWAQSRPIETLVAMLGQDAATWLVCLRPIPAPIRMAASS